MQTKIGLARVRLRLRSAQATACSPFLSAIGRVRKSPLIAPVGRRFLAAADKERAPSLVWFAAIQFAYQTSDLIAATCRTRF
jgi:hypothetical protein